MQHDTQEANSTESTIWSNLQGNFAPLVLVLNFQITELNAWVKKNLGWTEYDLGYCESFVGQDKIF